MIIFLFYIISTQFPTSSGKVVQFDEALNRLTVNGWDSAHDHFTKAIGFFSEHPISDAENCIKDGVCALEACLESITENPKSTDLNKMIRQLDELDIEKRIPPALAEGMKKLYAYRGDAVGVAHANSKGSRVSELEAELVLNMVSSYIIYLSDLYGKRTN